MERSVDQIIREIDAGKYYPVYFLTGEEPYFIDQITNRIEKDALPENMKAFNQLVFYGKDSNIRTILEAALRHPMMSDRQVVIVREAQELDYKNAGNEEKGKEEGKDALLHYLDHPNPATILVFAYKHKKFDARTKLAKALKSNEQTIFLATKKIKEYRIPEWIISYVSGKGMTIDMKAALLLTEHVGNSISNLVNELEKLIVSMPGNSTKITAADIEKYIGYSKDFNVFELQNAIIAGDVKKANRIVFYFCKNPKDHPLTVTLAVLYQFFVKILLYHQLQRQPRKEIAAAMKVPEFFLKDYAKAARRFPVTRLAAIISALRKTNARNRGIGNVSTGECDLLKELMFYILH